MMKFTSAATPAIFQHKRHNRGTLSQQKAARAMPAIDRRGPCYFLLTHVRSHNFWVEVWEYQRADWSRVSNRVHTDTEGAPENGLV